MDDLSFNTLATHDALLLQQIQSVWHRQICKQLQVIQQSAELRLNLVTRQVILSGDVVVFVVEVSNIGLGMARHVHLELLPHTAYQLVSNWVPVGDVASGQTRRVQFSVQINREVTLLVLALEVRLHYIDATSLTQIQDKQFSARLLRAPSIFRFIPNPYRAGPPLCAGSQTFVGREDDLAFIVRLLSSGQAHLVITGQRRMGKTSLLRQLGVHLGHTHAAVFLDGQRLGLDPGLNGFFYDIACEICTSLNLDCPDFDLFDERPAYAFEQIFLPEVLPSLQHRSLLMLFDEVEELEWRVSRGKLDHDLFNMLRHIMQHHPQLSFVFVGTHRIAELNPNYWSVMLNNALQYRIGHLPPASALKLITEPVKGLLCYDDLALERLMRLVSGHPYFLQLYCQVLVDLANTEHRTYVLSDHIDAALDRVFELGEGQLVEVWQCSSPYEQHILKTMAELCPPTTGAVNHSKLMAHLCEKSAHPDADETTWTIALNQLISHDILARASNASGEAYTWKLGVLGLWIRDHCFHTLSHSVAGTNR
ncbi:MAG: ATP-binding protein [Anaerolineae bacterium]|nr:ATP-binding protein [Anaerolineae bacterium]